MDGRAFRARRLRRDQTDAEMRLWSRLRNRQLDGWKFRRQAPVGRFVIDFLSVDARLVIELDGGQHAHETDDERTRRIEADGYLVIRFWNNEVNDNIEGVLVRILETLRVAPPHPNPLPDGERE
ncbi:DUF559 domain-containing protein [Ancylobacter sp. Lp-2]|uniref:endonuclease domain-containing protein n=1 Tax=Ancylobacter sp. Lp-2 TaxID=2881339 RepID=UPI001E2835ED|nr:DUF559 domain-containing protein [Ancylobacter sp. Lp-2]MCB4771133.1 DUF559 domain-containing protein [Ancylobacter sp. Lp-2]